MQALNIAIFGLSVTSSWGNGHATTFRSLIKALAKRGHNITFFEKDVPWYASNRDLPNPPFCETILYNSLAELKDYESKVSGADLVILGSYVQEADKLTDMIVKAGPGCFAFYDIDTPVTLAKLERGDYEYLTPEMIPQFDLYLSFTGGPTLEVLEQKWHAQRARPLFCSVDPDLYYPDQFGTGEHEYAMGYLGTYSDDRQPTVNSLLIKTAQALRDSNFCVAGAQYPEDIQWPENVNHVEHIPPQEHRQFYNAQRFTLNVTRQDMIKAGYSPSVRLFEAGACGTPIISDYWQGLGSIFEIGDEILVARNSEDVQDYLKMDDIARGEMGLRIRQRVLKSHTSKHRAMEIEDYWREVRVPTQAAAASS
jgi:spore maturation protein CgeB